jgi:hypothetical protein
MLKCTRGGVGIEGRPSAIGTGRSPRGRPGGMEIRTADRMDPARVFRPCDRLGRGAPAQDAANLFPLLQWYPNALFIEQGCAQSRGVGLLLHVQSWAAVCIITTLGLDFRHTQEPGLCDFRYYKPKLSGPEKSCASRKACQLNGVG